ncbi:MAG TPA: methyltransferase domain-containing protein [Geminicoccaceae bacterium]
MSVSVSADPAVAGGNHYPKYTARNPIARRLVDGFMLALADLARRSGARQVHEVGCGEGFLSTMLAQDGLAVRGSDISPSAVAIARRRAAELGLPASFRVADLHDLSPPVDGAELVVCCEVLEHLAEPARALTLLARLAQPHLVVSVPREPLWRLLNMARARYWAALGNTPGHLQHWSARGFLALLESHVEVCEVRTPLPWTMALCRRR